jgi:hypothetical protein
MNVTNQVFANDYILSNTQILTAIFRNINIHSSLVGKQIEGPKS